MATGNYKNRLFDFLIQPAFKVWRYLLFALAFIPLALSMPFYSFGGFAEIPVSTIYWFGAGLFIVPVLFCWINVFCLAPRYLPKGEYATYLIILFALCSGFVLFKYVAEYLVLSNAGIRVESNWVTLLDWFSNLVLYTVTIASTSVSTLLRQWMTDNTRIESLENKQLKSSIEEIKSRINPQFLYATLDYVSEKVITDPERSSETLFKLSALLSYQLYDNRRDSVLLESDIEHIRNYLTLEQQNSGHRFTFSISVTGKTGRFIPSNLFMPLIEEIIKQQPDRLMISFRTDHDRIQFECRAPDKRLPLNSLKKNMQQLELLHGDRLIFNKQIDFIELQFMTC